MIEERIELSRRAARIMDTEVIRKLSIPDRFSFARAVDAAKNFDALDKKWQRIIKKAEAEK